MTARRAVLHFASARVARKTLWLLLQNSHSARRVKWTSRRAELSKMFLTLLFFVFAPF
jgi:hypothetical protein